MWPIFDREKKSPVIWNTCNWPSAGDLFLFNFVGDILCIGIGLKPLNTDQSLK